MAAYSPMDQVLSINFGLRPDTSIASLGARSPVTSRCTGVIERIDEFAKELIALKPDVIVAGGSTAAMALARETSSVPIVFLAVEDPIAIGVVSSYARPSANVTGFMTF